ncbi:homoserine dehydrogenase [Vagococcus penaei]|uniref:Homoserine dehydrogenase n=1 Tax=Vagococcus penaei TaxID=633807 RepID=A0A1Q2D3M8_9ENTE|nr:homoserine dehydrogenase [Vagococcus penaei]AQP52976.1 homoserine dehydrogenase [Vagococcus penaei]RSU02564.1 homoserine dehydrogenase [Vagococcus penaei]
MGKKLRIGMLGLGTVGTGVVELFENYRYKVQQITGLDSCLAKVFVRNSHRKKALAERHHLTLVTDMAEIINDPTIDVVIEVLGGIEPAKTAISQALKSGKHVVTANKDLMAQCGIELQQLAKENACALYYEASVAGGIPILRTISSSLSSDAIEIVYGIVNGTTNYMLTNMTISGLTYQEALLEAQRLGFAEQDPTNDVEGIDAVYKMIILTQFAYGMTIKIDDVTRQGITHVTASDIQSARKLGYVIKLIGTTLITKEGVAVDVAPVFIAKTHPLASVSNEMNAIFVKSTGIGESMYYGPGAGATPTATSILSDVLTIAKEWQSGRLGQSFHTFDTDTKLIPKKSTRGKYYFSLSVPDEMGIFKKIAEIMENQQVSLKQINQEVFSPDAAHVALITHEMTLAQRDCILAAFRDIPDVVVHAYYKVL